MKTYIECMEDSIADLVSEIVELKLELSKRPKMVCIETKMLGGRAVLGVDHRAVRLEPQYVEVQIEFDKGLYRFISPVFTQDPEASIEATVYSDALGNLKVFTDPSTPAKQPSPSYP